MMAKNPWQLRLPTCVLFLAFGLAACQQHDNRPAPPQTAEPAPPPAVAPGEDRGQQPAGEPAAAGGDDYALSHADSGEAERAASKRGHDSADETPPATQPGSGQ